MIKIRMLGNLEVLDHGAPVLLGGLQPRATLGYLLLRRNSVVPASKLIEALWPAGGPATARKMLHNAVSQVRRVLDRGGAEAPVLLTHAPGYFLQVPPEALDLTRFQSLADRGGAELAERRWDQAAETLRMALDVWRGPALVDLVETGIDWPEVTSLENARLVALEDRAEALLAMERYSEVIATLEKHVGSGPRRERMSGCLMRALYCCGRQVDALDVYRHTRTALIEEFGLDPSPALQELERAILNHDVAPPSALRYPLFIPEETGAEVPALRTSEAVATQAAAHATQPADAWAAKTMATGPVAAYVAGWAPCEADAARAYTPSQPSVLTVPGRNGESGSIAALSVPVRTSAPLREHAIALKQPVVPWKSPLSPQVSALGQHTQEPVVPQRWANSAAGRTPSTADVRVPSAALAPTAQTAADTAPPALTATGRAEEPAGELKQISLVLLSVRSGHEEAADPEHADETRVHIAAVLRQQAESWGGEVAGALGPYTMAVFGANRTCESVARRAVWMAHGVRDLLGEQTPAATDGRRVPVALAVSTGEALVRPSGQESRAGLSIAGPVVDRALRLVDTAAPGGVALCGSTRRAVDLTTQERAGASVPPLIGREPELRMLDHWWQLVGRRRRLVTVLGEAGMGKSRLVDEFARKVSGGPDGSRCLVGRVPPRHVGHGPFAALNDVLHAYAGVTPADPAAVVREKVTHAVDDLEGLGDLRERLLEHLWPSPGDGANPASGAEVLQAWTMFLEQVALQRPTVLVFEDLHLADDTLLDMITGVFTRSGPVPLLAVVTARPELVERRPGWGGGVFHSSTMTLEPLSERDIRGLLRAMSSYDTDERDSRGIATNRADTAERRLPEPLESAVAWVGGNPLFAGEYAHMVLDNQRSAAPSRDDGSWASQSRGQIPVMPIPSTVREVVDERIDLLPAPVKAVLMDASVLGERGVYVSALAAASLRQPGVPRERLLESLEYLERWEILERTGHISVTGEPEYAFRHLLIREVVYSRLPRATRAAKHRNVAKWFRQDVGEEKLAAFHGERGGTQS